MRDWSRAFLRASFKGVRFWVDDEGRDGGRRIAVQHVAYGELPIIEDFGSVEATFGITAYLASDVADLESRLLTAVLGSPGPGPLVLPQEGFLLAHVVDFSRNRSKDRNGYIAFDLNFVRAGGGLTFGLSFNVNGALASLATLASVVAGAFGR